MMILVLKFLLIVARVSFALACKMIQTLRDVFDSNGDGVIDRRQVVTKSADGSGNVAEIWTDDNGGGIKLDATNDNDSVSLWECAA